MGFLGRDRLWGDAMGQLSLNGEAKGRLCKTDCAYLLEALHGLVHQGRHLDLRALHLFLDLFVLAGVLLQGIQFSLQ